MFKVRKTSALMAGARKVVRLSPVLSEQAASLACICSIGGRAPLSMNQLRRKRRAHRRRTAR